MSQPVEKSTAKPAGLELADDPLFSDEHLAKVARLAGDHVREETRRLRAAGLLPAEPEKVKDELEAALAR